MAPPTLRKSVPPPITPRPPLTKEEWVSELSRYFRDDSIGSEIWEYASRVLIKNGELKETPPGSGKYSLNASLSYSHILEAYFKEENVQTEDILEILSSIPPYPSGLENQSLSTPAQEPEDLLPDVRAAPFIKGDWMKKIREHFYEPGNPFPSEDSDKIFNCLVHFGFVEEAGYHDYRREKTYRLTKRLGKEECLALALANER